MIEADTFGLKGFDLVESSEAGMLSAVTKAAGTKKDVVFLGWEPHPMNSMVDMKYLTGGDDVFGPNFGGADGRHQRARRLCRPSARMSASS